MQPASELVRMLKSDNYFERQSAAWKLVEMGEEAAEPLIEALQNDESSLARMKSAWSLGKICDARAFDHLARALVEDEDEAVRIWSAVALEAMGDPKAVPTLAQALRSDGSDDVRHRAARALVALEAAETFLELLEEPDATTRVLAIEGAGRLNCLEAMDAVASQIGDEVEEVRRRVAWFLGEMGTADAGELLRPVLEDESHTVRMIAAKSLASIGGPDACQMALRLTDDGHPLVRQTAVTTLGEIGLSDALDRLVEIMFGDDEEEIRAWAAWSLGEIGDRLAIGALKVACQSCPSQVQEKAQDSLRQVFGVEPEENLPE